VTLHSACQLKNSWQTLAQASMRVATMPALVLKRSSRVMPGLRGTPAGITTTLLCRVSCEDRIGTGPPRARTDVVYVD